MFGPLHMPDVAPMGPSAASTAVVGRLKERLGGDRQHAWRTSKPSFAVFEDTKGDATGQPRVESDEEEEEDDDVYDVHAWIRAAHARHGIQDQAQTAAGQQNGRHDVHGSSYQAAGQPRGHASSPLDVMHENTSYMADGRGRGDVSGGVYGMAAPVKANQVVPDSAMTAHNNVLRGREPCVQMATAAQLPSSVHSSVINSVQARIRRGLAGRSEQRRKAAEAANPFRPWVVGGEDISAKVDGVDAPRRKRANEQKQEKIHQKIARASQVVIPRSAEELMKEVVASPPTRDERDGTYASLRGTRVTLDVDDEEVDQPRHRQSQHGTAVKGVESKAKQQRRIGKGSGARATQGGGSRQVRHPAHGARASTAQHVEGARGKAVNTVMEAWNKQKKEEEAVLHAGVRGAPQLNLATCTVEEAVRRITVGQLVDAATNDVVDEYRGAGGMLIFSDDDLDEDDIHIVPSHVVQGPVPQDTGCTPTHRARGRVSNDDSGESVPRGPHSQRRSKTSATPSQAAARTPNARHQASGYIDDKKKARTQRTVATYDGPSNAAGRAERPRRQRGRGADTTASRGPEEAKKRRGSGALRGEESRARSSNEAGAESLVAGGVKHAEAGGTLCVSGMGVAEASTGSGEAGACRQTPVVNGGAEPRQVHTVRHQKKKRLEKERILRDVRNEVSALRRRVDAAAEEEHKAVMLKEEVERAMQEKKRMDEELVNAQERARLAKLAETRAALEAMADEARETERRERFTIMRGVFGVLRDLMTQRRKQLRICRQRVNAHRLFVNFRAWRMYIVDLANEREEERERQAILLVQRKEQIAAKHHTESVVRRVLFAWRNVRWVLRQERLSHESASRMGRARELFTNGLVGAMELVQQHQDEQEQKQGGQGAESTQGEEGVAATARQAVASLVGGSTGHEGTGQHGGEPRSIADRMNARATEMRRRREERVRRREELVQSKARAAAARKVVEQEVAERVAAEKLAMARAEVTARKAAEDARTARIRAAATWRRQRLLRRAVKALDMRRRRRRDLMRRAVRWSNAQCLKRAMWTWSEGAIYSEQEKFAAARSVRQRWLMKTSLVKLARSVVHAEHHVRVASRHHDSVNLQRGWYAWMRGISIAQEERYEWEAERWYMAVAHCDEKRALERHVLHNWRDHVASLLQKRRREADLEEMRQRSQAILEATRSSVRGGRHTGGTGVKSPGLPSGGRQVRHAKGRVASVAEDDAENVSTQEDAQALVRALLSRVRGELLEDEQRL